MPASPTSVFAGGLSIRARLALGILATNLLLLVLGGGAIIYHDVHNFEKLQLAQVQSLARAYAQGFSRVLVLDDRDAAADLVTLFSSYPDIEQAYLYNRDLQPMFRHQAQAGLPPPRPPRDLLPHTERSAQALSVYLPLSLEGITYGVAFVRMSTEAVHANIREHVLGLLAFAPLMVLVSMVAAWAGQRYFTRPIVALRDQLRQVTKTKDFDVVLTTDQRNEIGDLYDGLNDMLREIRAAHQALLESNQQLEVKVTERTRELEDSRAHLVESEKMAALGGLVAGIAHEVNTPIGIGLTAASHLQEAAATIRSAFDTNAMKASQLRDFLGTSQESAQIIQRNLSRAADLIRSFKQVATDQSHEDRRRFELREYLRELQLSLTPKYKKTPHSFTVVCDQEIDMDSYPGAISQIVTNLVSNSLDHAFDADSAGVMRLTVSPQADHVHLVYSDNGRGINFEHQEKVFNPFFTTRRSEGNTGLGMHIIYNLATQTLGGKLRLHSSPGEGLELRLALPLRAPDNTAG